VSAGRVLVIAPDPAFRRSLAFALEAEGHVVTAVPTLPAGPVENQDAVVLDHKAATGGVEPLLFFCRNAPPVVLLAGQPRKGLAEAVFSVVLTPIRGGALVEAVAAALGAGTPLAASASPK
jgi:CheY-like chemotaxis protein